MFCWSLISTFYGIQWVWFSAWKFLSLLCHALLYILAIYSFLTYIYICLYIYYADIHNVQVTGKWCSFQTEKVCNITYFLQTLEIKMCCLIHDSLLLVHFLLSRFSDRTLFTSRNKFQINIYCSENQYQDISDNSNIVDGEFVWGFFGCLRDH